MEGQPRDCRERPGVPFQHAAYPTERTQLRHKLKAGLAGVPPGEGEAPDVAELAEKIKTLKAANTVEVAPQRAARKACAEEPVTARIRIFTSDADGEWRRRVTFEGERKAGRA